MAEYSEQLDRIRAFDTLIEATDTLLSLDVVRSALGETALLLLKENKQAFLPTVNHDRIEISGTDIDSDGAAVLPLRDDEEKRKFIQSYVFSKATPRKQTVLEQAVEAQGYSVDAYRYFRQQVHSAMLDDPIVVAHYEHSRASFHSSFYEDRTMYVHYSARPLIMVPSRTIDRESTIGLGLTMCHEYMHVLDAEHNALVFGNDRNELARVELRAYATEAIIINALKDQPGVDMDDLQRRRAVRVENLRIQFNSPDDPFATPLPLVDELERLGVILQDFGSVIE